MTFDTYIPWFWTEMAPEVKRPTNVGPDPLKLLKTDFYGHFPIQDKKIVPESSQTRKKISNLLNTGKSTPHGNNNEQE
jgi:hypothetical protein